MLTPRKVTSASLTLAATVVLIAGTASPAFAGAPGPAPHLSQCPAPSPGHVTCLSQSRPEPIPAPHSSTTATGTVSPALAAPSAGYGPADLASAYGIPSGATTTATVAVVDYGITPTLEADMNSYRSAFGLPSCTSASGCLTVLNPTGTAPQLTAGSTWALEAALDVEMVSAVCPTCHILFVATSATGQAVMGQAVLAAVTAGATYVSMSWGGAEGSPGTEAGYDRAYLGASNVTYVAAAGDTGYGVMWPAASPDAISVGGTSLVRDPGSGRGWSESVWDTSSTHATGSGCSANEPQPSWQATISALTAVCGHRADNDVSVVGDPNTGVDVYTNGTWWLVGGTSAGAPIIAAMYALTGESTGTAAAAAYAYAHPSAFTTVTSGSNGSCGTVLCTAGPGWNGPTGLGTPQGVSALADVTTDHGTDGGGTPEPPSGSGSGSDSGTGTGGSSGTGSGGSGSGGSAGTGGGSGTGSGTGGGDSGSGGSTGTGSGDSGSGGADGGGSGTTPPPPQKAGFTDVPPGNRFATAIDWLTTEKITGGYPDGGFHPAAQVSRQAMAAFLYRLAHDGKDAPACATGTFTDVPAGSSFCGAIAWLAGAGISTGYSGGTFAPDAPISRGAMAAFLYRLDHHGADAPACITATFTDVPTDSPFCGAIAWLAAQKITGGYGDGGFHPTADITRQAMAAFLYRLEH